MNEHPETTWLARIAEFTVQIGESHPEAMANFWPHLGEFTRRVIQECVQLPPTPPTPKATGE